MLYFAIQYNYSKKDSRILAGLPAVYALTQQLDEWRGRCFVEQDTVKTENIKINGKTVNNLPLIHTTTGHIERVNSTKLLGFHLDSNLPWQAGTHT